MLNLKLLMNSKTPIVIPIHTVLPYSVMYAALWVGRIIDTSSRLVSMEEYSTSKRVHIKMCE